jgi:hypothetical protein
MIFGSGVAYTARNAFTLSLIMPNRLVIQLIAGTAFALPTLEG